MMDNADLKTYVSGLADSAGLPEMYASMDDLLAKWAGVEDIDPNANRGDYNAIKLAA